MVITRQLTDAASANTATDIQLGSCVTEIGIGAFSGYTNITDVEFPESLTTIGARAFYDSSITLLTLPSGTTSIGASAFNGCSNLGRINVEAITPPTLGANAFDGSDCSIYVPSQSYNNYINSWIPYRSRIVFEGSEFKIHYQGAIDRYVICDDTKTIYSGESNINYVGVTATTIGDCVKIINPRAFSGSSNYYLTLGTVRIPSSVVSIGINGAGQYHDKGAFKYCNIDAVYMDKTVPPSIYNKVFYDDYYEYSTTDTFDFKSNYLIHVPEGSYNAYLEAENWTVLGPIIISPDANYIAKLTRYDGVVKYIPPYIYNTWDGSFNHSAIDYYDNHILHYLVGETNLVSVEVTNNCTRMNCDVFSACTNLSSITIADNVRFEQNTYGSGFTNTSLPIIDNVMYADKWAVWLNGATSYCNLRDNTTAIYNISGITRINSDIDGVANIPSGVTQIGRINSSGITSCTIGSKIEEIVNLTGMTNLRKLTILATTPPQLLEQWRLPDLTIYVPCNSVNAYKTAWSQYATQIFGLPPCETPIEIGSDKYYALYSDGFIHRVTSCSQYNTYISSTETNWNNKASNVVEMGIGNCVTSMNLSPSDVTKNVETVKFGDDPHLSSLASQSFQNCTKLSKFNSDIEGTFNLPNSLTNITTNVFQDCTSLKHLIIPSSVTSGINFKGCSNLSTVDFVSPSHVSALTYSCFADSKLTTITIPDSVTSIDSGALSGCTSLTSCTIGSGVTSLGYYVFRGCTNLSNITMPNVTSIGQGTFSGCTSITNISLQNVTSIGIRTFEGCSALTSVTLGDSLTSIGNNAFENCKNLTSINIPSAVTSIGDAVFNGCRSLTSITVDSNNSTYDSRNDCNALIKTSNNQLIKGCNSTIIPDSVTSLYKWAFAGCTGFTSVTINSGMTSIGDKAFKDCTSLESIIVEATTPPTLGTEAFHNTNSCPIYVPAESVEAYKVADNWVGYETRIQAIPTE